MTPYAEQVLICTGKDDWTSKIEEENSGDNLAADLSELLGRGGTYADVLPPFSKSPPMEGGAGASFSESGEYQALVYRRLWENLTSNAVFV